MVNTISTKYLKGNIKIVTADSIFHTCCWLYLVALTILPDWFGFNFLMLFSAKRIMLLVCYAFIIFGRKRLNNFLRDLKTYKWAHIIIALYMIVRLYTAVLRVDLQAFAGEFLDGVLVFYLIAYILKHELGINTILKFLRIVLWILVIEGIFEYLTHINLFAFLDTTNQFAVITSIRDGGLRIQSNCHHPIHYGIYVSILFLLSCFDYEKKKIYLFYNPALFLLSLIAIYLSGSRAPLGVFLLSCVVLIFFSRKDDLIKSLIILFAVFAIAVLFLFLVGNTSLGKEIWQSLAMFSDQLFGTTFVADFFNEELANEYFHSAEYRKILYNNVFALDYLNKFLGRGVNYHFSIVIDGYWFQSIDSAYIAYYIEFAYPGLITFIMLLLFMAGTVLYGMFKTKGAQKLYAAILVAFICYFINIWYVATMGTFMYIWMLFAIAYVANQNIKNKGVSK